MLKLEKHDCRKLVALLAGLRLRQPKRRYHNSGPASIALSVVSSQWSVVRGSDVVVAHFACLPEIFQQLTTDH